MRFQFVFFLYLVITNGVGIQQDIKSEQILTQVARICKSRELNSKSQLCRLLNYLVEETLKGRKEKLKEYTVGVELFEKGLHYDTNQDPMVRINAGRLRRMLKLYYLDSGRNDPIRIEIPKGKYIPVFLSNVNHVDETKESIGYRKVQSVVPVIAILPFQNMTGDPQKDYFSFGFSEELAVEFTKFEELVVFDSIQFSHLDQTKIRDLDLYVKLGIHFLIEGSIHMHHKQIKVIVRLSDVDQGKLVWAERFTGDLSVKDLVEIQEKISREIAYLIGSEYGIIPQVLSRDIKRIQKPDFDTYDAILKFYYFEAHHTPTAFREAFKALTQTVGKHPESGVAAAMLATLHGNIYMLDQEEAEKSYIKMGHLIERALELDPDSILVRVVFLYKCFTYNEKDVFFREADHCLSMNPNSPLKLGAIGFYLSLYGEWERGKSVLDQVMKTTLHFPKIFFGATTLYYYRRKEYETALSEANQYKLENVFWAPMLRAAVLGQLEQTDAAKSHIDHLKQLKPDFEEKVPYLISRYVKEEVLMEHIMEGLRKAGMEIQ